MFGGLIDGRLGAVGKEGLVAIEGFEGRVVGREIFGNPPAPPREGREPPTEGNLPEFPPRFGIEGRVLTFPKEGRETFGRETFGMLGLLGILGREMFGILGRAPPLPMCPIEGLAPPPPPPLVRCAHAVGNPKLPTANATIAKDKVRPRLITDIGLLLRSAVGFIISVHGLCCGDQ